MDTVLGLAITPSTIGWVTADGGNDGFPTVTGDQISVIAGEGRPDAVTTAAAAVSVASRIRTMLASRQDRLRGVAVTWSDDATVGAALLLEALADAGFEQVVPVRFGQAVAALAGAVDPRCGRVAVCVIEAGLATLFVFAHAGDTDPVVAQCPIKDVDDVAGWLSTTLGSGACRPEMLVVAGAMRGMDRLARRLASRLSMPVAVREGAQLALARGAAIALAPHLELAGPSPAAAYDRTEHTGRRRPRSWPRAAALLMLAVGAVAFVGSVAAVVSLQLVPNREVPITPPAQHATVARVAIPSSPPSAAPTAPPPASETESADAVPPDSSAEFGSLWDAPEVEPDISASAPGEGGSRLDRVREHIFGPSGS